MIFTRLAGNPNVALLVRPMVPDSQFSLYLSSAHNQALYFQDLGVYKLGPEGLYDKIVSCIANIDKILKLLIFFFN